jgi:DNA-binding FadR family transcriptional regulator
MGLPSIREAERVFGVSRTTVQQAYQALVIHQLIESKPGSGYVVRVQSGNAWISQHRIELECFSNHHEINWSGPFAGSKISDEVGQHTRS